jgi:S1-C subfamily serine protease
MASFKQTWFFFLLTFVFSSLYTEHRLAHSDGIVKYTSEYVFKIEGSNGTRATGFRVVTPKGEPMIITNYHVCVDYKSTRYSIREHTGRLVPLSIYKYNAAHDLCALRPKVAPATGLVLGTELAQFDNIMSVGHPRGGPVFVSRGVFTGVKKNLDVPHAPALPLKKGWWCPKNTKLMGYATRGGLAMWCSNVWDLGSSTLEAWPGSSGSPVVDKDGYVVGVVSVSDEGRGYFVLAKDLYKFWKGL